MQHNQPIESSRNAVEMESNQPIESSQNAVEMESSISSDDDQELHRVDISQLQVNNNDPEDLPSQSQQSIDEENDCDEENERTPSAKNTATKPTRTQSNNQSHKPTSYVSTTVDIDDEGMNTPHSINRSESDSPNVFALWRYKNAAKSLPVTSVMYCIYIAHTITHVM
eukprot:784978_1